ncbi:hypothetical protein AB4306_18465 [Vibrio splendidus]|uniref:hypothetical protein n=1 Tax=Vibrio splendidus TaxID=29497 RepID=UPI00076A1556|nr:hypothetical protein [Vibrio splendidus]PHX05473.1 hypothetical protein VSPL_28670 [Vibrio splendidus]
MFQKLLIGLIAVLLLSLSSFQISANIATRMKANRAKATTAIEMNKLKVIYEECKRDSLYEAQSKDTQKLIRNACTNLAVSEVKAQQEDDTEELF